MDWREQVWKGVKFIVLLGIISAMVYALLLALQDYVIAITALGSSWVLNLLGISSSAEGSMIMFNEHSAKIVWLCTGSLELALLLGAVIATEDRTWKQRVLGIVFSTVMLYIINIVRVGVTLASAVWYGWNFADLIHTVLFKFFLVFAILGVYAIWYLWLSKRIT